MKAIILSCLLIGSTIAICAQKTTTLPTAPKTELINKLKITDLIITIDKIDDVSNPAYTASPRYDVQYTVTNSGTEDISGLLISLQANFYKPDGTLIPGNTNFGLAGPQSEQNEVRVIKPGAVVKRTVSVYPQQPLYFTTSYKLVVKVDSQNNIAETNENNNTAERTVSGHSDYSDADYYLSKVTLTLQTGNDNKEKNNSGVNFFFRTGDGIKNFWHVNYDDEIKVNTTSNISIEYEGTTDPGNKYNSQNTLQYYRKHGFIMDIIYSNWAFKTDAWKINNASVTLQFKTREGTASPAYGNKTYNFSGANGILGFRVGDNPLSNQYQKRVLRLLSCSCCSASNPMDAMGGTCSGVNFTTEESLGN